MPMIMDLFEFRQLHGDDFIRQGQMEIYADGACVEHRFLMPDLFLNPPTDPAKVLKLRIQFHETKATLYEEAFTACKAALLGQSRNGFPSIPWRWDERRLGPPPADRDGKVALLTLKAMRDPHAEAIAKLKAEYEALPEVIDMRQREAQMRASTSWSQQIDSREYAEISEIDL